VQTISTVWKKRQPVLVTDPPHQTALYVYNIRAGREFVWPSALHRAHASG
jgi:hypothetical protein